MGDPREGMPIPSVSGRECPENTLETESSVDVWVVDDIDIVIEVDESIVSNLPESCQGQKNDEKRNHECQKVGA